jgi:SCP-2 sterol transfer family
MDEVWKTSLARQYDIVIDRLDAAVRECPDELWEASVWEVKKTHAHVWPIRRVDDKKTRRGDESLLPVVSAFWNVAYHTLFHIDFYLSGAVLRGFEPPPPFREDEHRAHVVPNRPYTREELHRYAAYDREKARQVIGGLTDAQTGQIVKRAGVPFAEFLLRTLLHTQEHAAQLSLLLGQRGIEPRGGAGAEQRRQALREAVRGRSDGEIDAWVRSRGGYDRLLPLVLAGFCSSMKPREACSLRMEIGSGYVIRAAPGEAATWERIDGAPTDATLTMSRQDFLRWMTGDLTFRSGMAHGRIAIDGDVEAMQQLFASRSAGR